MTLQSDLRAELAELRGETVPADVVRDLRAEVEMERLGRLHAEAEAREMRLRVRSWNAIVTEYVECRAGLDELKVALADRQMGDAP